jgi:hypothetical protein
LTMSAAKKANTKTSQNTSPRQNKLDLHNWPRKFFRLKPQFWSLPVWNKKKRFYIHHFFRRCLSKIICFCKSRCPLSDFVQGSRLHTSNQGCQMVSFRTKIPIRVYFGGPWNWKCC